jgi:transcriptional regulator with XRE-family HTH domain
MPTKLDNQIELRSNRAFHNLSIRAMAKRVGLAPSYVADLESGKRDVSKAVADVFKREFGLQLHAHVWQCDCGEIRD